MPPGMGGRRRLGRASRCIVPDFTRSATEAPRLAATHLPDWPFLSLYLLGAQALEKKTPSKMTGVSNLLPLTLVTEKYGVSSLTGWLGSPRGRIHAPRIVTSSPRGYPRRPMIWTRFPMSDTRTFCTGGWPSIGRAGAAAEASRGTFSVLFREVLSTCPSAINPASIRTPIAVPATPNSVPSSQALRPKRLNQMLSPVHPLQFPASSAPSRLRQLWINLYSTGEER